MKRVLSRNCLKLREQIEDMNRQIQKAKNDYDLNRAAELQYGELPKLQQMLEAEEKKVKNEDLSGTRECNRRRNCQNRLPLDRNPGCKN